LIITKVIAEEKWNRADSQKFASWVPTFLGKLRSSYGKE
jgi:hypothetical protein